MTRLGQTRTLAAAFLLWLAGAAAGACGSVGSTKMGTDGGQTGSGGAATGAGGAATGAGGAATGAGGAITGTGGSSGAGGGAGSPGGMLLSGGVQVLGPAAPQSGTIRLTNASVTVTGNRSCSSAGCVVGGITP